MTRERETGAWVVKSYHAHIDSYSWLLGGPHDPHTRRSWWSWGSLKDARVYPSLAAARRAMKGYERGEAQVITYERI